MWNNIVLVTFKLKWETYTKVKGSPQNKVSSTRVLAQVCAYRK